MPFCLTEHIYHVITRKTHLQPISGCGNALCVAMTTHMSHGKPPGRRHDVVSSDVKALLRPKPALKEGTFPLLYNEHCQNISSSNGRSH